MTGSEAEHQSQFLPPGFRFHPTDEELIQHYLRKRDAGEPCPVPIIAEVDIYKFNPWDLPSMAKQHHQQQGADSYGCSEWYFFSPRDRKYPNGARPNRSAGSGYWKATGTDKPILATSNTAAVGGERATGRIGVKKALVFYKGKPPRGIKTNWIMHEYRLTDHQQPSQFYHVLHPVKNKDTSSMRLDDWVLCRIYEKTHNHRESPGTPTDDQPIPGGVDVGDMDDSKNNFVALQPRPSSYPSGTSTSNLDKGSLWDILCGVDADYSMLSQLRFTAGNPQRNPTPDLRLQQHRQPSSAKIGKSPMNITSAINSASLSASYFNSGNSVDGSDAISTTVLPISELHQWPPLPQEPPTLKAMATSGWCLKRHRESDDGFLGHMESAVVALHLAKKERTDWSSGISTKNTATSNSCVLPGYENLLGTPSQFGAMDTQAYQLGHHDILPNPKFLRLQ